MQLSKTSTTKLAQQGSVLSLFLQTHCRNKWLGSYLKAIQMLSVPAVYSYNEQSWVLLNVIQFIRKNCIALCSERSPRMRAPGVAVWYEISVDNEFYDKISLVGTKLSCIWLRKWLSVITVKHAMQTMLQEFCHFLRFPRSSLSYTIIDSLSSSITFFCLFRSQMQGVTEEQFLIYYYNRKE